MRHAAFFAVVMCGWCVAEERTAWPRFRGPDGAGVATGARFPLKFGAKDFAWTTRLPGVGHGAVAVWGDVVFATSSDEMGVERRLSALSLETGKIAWTKSLKFATHPKHAKNTYAISAPAVDDERVYVNFADEEHYRVGAWTHAGEEVWSVDLGPFSSQHGHGASTIVFEDLLIVPNDQDGESHLHALDRRNGKKVWAAPRASREASYATPLVIESPGKKPQLVCVSGMTGVSSYDPWEGKLLWETGSLPKRTVASPVYAGGLVLATCGQGAKGHTLLAIDPFGEPRIRWQTDKQLPYVPSPLVHEGLVYLWGDAGIVHCLDLASGNTVWVERVGGKFSASPVCANNAIYAVSEEGEVVVIAAKKQYELLGTGQLGATSFAAPAIAGTRMVFRTYEGVMCLRGEGVDGGASRTSQ